MTGHVCSVLVLWDVEREKEEQWKGPGEGGVGRERARGEGTGGTGGLAGSWFMSEIGGARRQNGARTPVCPDSAAAKGRQKWAKWPDQG